MNRPLVSIIIVNWNGAHLLEECLSSLIKTTYQNKEIIIVDNNSSDNSEEIVKKFNDVIFYKNDSNSGYTGGNNIGFKLAKGKYLVTLNNDISVDPNWLDRSIDILEKNPTTGIVSCRQMQYYKPKKIDSLFNDFNTALIFLPFGAGEEYTSKKVYSEVGYILIANGGSAVLRREMLEQIGDFDERFFAYYDETDLCMRANLYGWKVIYNPDAIVFHKGSQSFKNISLKQYYYRERNRVWFFYKFFPLSFILKKLPFILIFELRIIRVFFLKCKNPYAYFKTRLEAFKSLKYYRQIRKNNLTLFKIHKKEICRLLRIKLDPIQNLM